jgi:hypothetical protein
MNEEQRAVGCVVQCRDAREANVDYAPERVERDLQGVEHFPQGMHRGITLSPIVTSISSS